MRSLLNANWIWLLLVAASTASAQTCNQNVETIKKILKTTDDPRVAFRAAAVGGEAVIPTLRSLAEQPKGKALSGTAEIALADLGDEATLSRLRSEIERDPESAIAKLVKVRTEESLSILMSYLIAHRDDRSRIKDAGDYIIDPLEPAIRGIIDMVENPPFLRVSTAPEQLERWKIWWESSHPPRVVSILNDVHDPESRCMARLSQWGYSDAVFELYGRLGKDSIPMLHKLSRMGDKSYPTSPVTTVRGSAQAVLAKAGDSEEFQRIVRELNGSGYLDAIEKLRYIGGNAAFEALLRSLSLDNFMPEVARSTNKSYLDMEGQKFRVAVMAALSKMADHPPLPADAPPTKDNMRIWFEWWDLHKGSSLSRKG